MSKSNCNKFVSPPAEFAPLLLAETGRFAFADRPVFFRPDRSVVGHVVKWEWPNVYRKILTFWAASGSSSCKAI
jgi:hypothetical protein